MKLTLAIVITWYVRASVQSVVSLAQGQIRGTPRDGFISYGGIPYTSINGPTGRFKVSCRELLQYN